MKRFLFFIGILALILGGAFFVFSRALQNPERIQENLIAELQDRWGLTLSFQEAAVRFAPFPVLKVSKPHLESINGAFSPLSAEEARLSFRFLPLLWGQVRVSGIQIREAAGDLWGIPLEKVHFKIKRLNSKKPAPFEWKGAGGGAVLEGKGKVLFENAGENFWKRLAFESRVSFNSFSLSQGLDERRLKFFPEPVQTSQWKGTFRLAKEGGADLAQGSVEFETQNAAGETKFLWNLEEGLVDFKRSSLKTPFGEWEGTGIFNTETGEVKEARLIGRKMILEELIRFFPSVDAWLPLDTGFSGESEFDMTLRGTWDYLAIHANWNLGPAVLTYGQVFSKPKDFPMGINFDLVLKNQSLLSGDFSTRIGETTLKGALVSADLKTGEGELTLLTNKFELKDWPSLLTSFASYQMSGSAKVLLSLKGNLTRPDQAEKMLNLTLVQASLLSAAGRGIQEATGQLDLSPLNLKIKNAALKIQGTSLKIETEIYHFAQNAQGKIQVLSAQFYPLVFLENLHALNLPFFEGLLSRLPFEKLAPRFIPREIPFEDFSLELVLGPGQLTLNQLEFNSLAGGFRFRGERKQSVKGSSFWIETECDQVSLARYFEARGEANEALEGNLFFQGRFESSEALTGRGTLSITNGKWNSLDFIESLKAVKGFESILTYQSNALSFHDLKAVWTYKEGKFSTEDLLIHSEDFWIEGKGDLSREGMLNARLEIYLSKFLTERLFESWQATEPIGEKKLGPIPYLLLEKLTKPELRIEDRSLTPLLEAIRSRRFRKLLREPFKD